MFFKKNKIAVDLGASSIKVADLKVSGKKATINDFVVIPLQPGVIDAGDVVNPDVIAASLSQGLAKKKIRSSPSVVGMFGSSVIVKKLTMPKMDEKIVGEQLRWEAEQYIPFNIDEAVFDFHILSKSKASESMEVLLVAARQENLFRYYEAIEGAGLKCQVVDVNGIALANCFEFNYGVIPEVVALVNVGANVSNLVILEAGKITFSRDIPYGGSLYDSEISRELGVDAMDAEGLKLGASYNQETPQEVLTAINYINETVGQEISNSFDFYNAANDGTVNQIFICGGASQTPGLFEKIQDSAQVQCSWLDPFQKIDFNQKTLDAEYFEQIRRIAPTAIGLALRNLG